MYIFLYISMYLSYLVLLSPLSPALSFSFGCHSFLPPSVPVAFLLFSSSSFFLLLFLFFSPLFPVLLFSPLSPFLLFLLLLVLRWFLFSVFSSSITGFSLSFSSHFLASSFASLFSCSSLSLSFLSLLVFRCSSFASLLLVSLYWGSLVSFFGSFSFSLFFLFLCLFLCSSVLSFVFRFSWLLPFFLLFSFSSSPSSSLFLRPFCIPPRFGCRLLAVRFLRCSLLPPPSPSPSSACSLCGLSLSSFSSGLPLLPFFVSFPFLASSVPLVLSLVSFLFHWQRFTGLPLCFGFAFVCFILFVCSDGIFCALETVGSPIFIFCDSVEGYSDVCLFLLRGNLSRFVFGFLCCSLFVFLESLARVFCACFPALVFLFLSFVGSPSSSGSLPFPCLPGGFPF